METNIFKSMRGGYGAESMTETDANGQAWQISTMKNSRGFLVCSAIQGDVNERGIFSYEMFGAKRLELANEETKCTEAAVKRVHEAGLIAFAKVQEETPTITAPAYVVGIGQILFTEGFEEKSKRAICEIKSPGHFKTVLLDGTDFKHDDHVRSYDEKFGIGTYYNQGEKISLEEVNNLINQANQAIEERHQTEQKAQTLAAIERNQKIAAGIKIIPAIPEGVKAVIVAEELTTTFDPYADYQSFTDHTERIIYLAFSDHTRDIFSEMRKAAGKFEATKQFETAPEKPEGAGEYWHPEDEHREKYSMGSGYFLRNGHNGGWRVRKYNVPSLETLQIAAAEGRFMCDVKEQHITTKDAPSFEKVEVKTGEVQIIDYSEKAFAVIGDTRPIKDKLKELGGKFNFRLSCGPGWIFSKSKLDTVTKALTPDFSEKFDRIDEPRHTIGGDCNTSVND